MAMKYIDIPPVWLAIALWISFQVARLQPFGLSFGGAWADFLGGLFVGAGLVLVGLAVIEMRKWRTTVIPHQEADHLVTSGIFKRSRNPIYLGDVLVLTGLILTWDAPLALPLVPAFVWLLETRFIIPEEAALWRKFKATFHRYTQNTRRWI